MGFNTFVSYRVYDHDSLTNKLRKASSKMLQIEDEEEAYHYDIQKENCLLGDHFYKVSCDRYIL